MKIINLLSKIKGVSTLKTNVTISDNFTPKIIDNFNVKQSIKIKINKPKIKINKTESLTRFGTIKPNISIKVDKNPKIIK